MQADKPGLSFILVSFTFPGCFYNGAVIANGQTIPDPGNLCSECTCQVAGSTLTPTVLTATPVQPAHLTPISVQRRVAQSGVGGGRAPLPPAPTPSQITVGAPSVKVGNSQHQ